jgi:hypothetical protein
MKKIYDHQLMEDALWDVSAWKQQFRKPTPLSQ